MNFIDGGITAPEGFKASGIYCGLRKNKTKKDLAIIYSEQECDAAAVYTQNKVKGAPIIVTKKHLEDKKAKAVIVNSGNANTCNADGEEKANAMCKALAKELSIKETDCIIASTGVIGQKLDVEKIEVAIPDLVKALSKEGGADASEAILTTDTTKKEFAMEIIIDNKKVKIGAIAKGSGMIHPNMATLLAFITTDVNISGELLKVALLDAIGYSLNRVSVDGDTSTNDMASIMANGLAKNTRIETKNNDYEMFLNALRMILIEIAKAIAKDGEGATKLLQCNVYNAKSEEDAVILAKSVITSSLVKSAMFGNDANWGRILCALGYSGVDFDEKIPDVKFISKSGEILVCKNGSSIEFSEEMATLILKNDEVVIDIDLKQGNKEGFAFGCDLTYDYVRINGDYRS